MGYWDYRVLVGDIGWLVSWILVGGAVLFVLTQFVGILLALLALVALGIALTALYFAAYLITGTPGWAFLAGLPFGIWLTRAEAMSIASYFSDDPFFPFWHVPGMTYWFVVTLIAAVAVGVVRGGARVLGYPYEFYY